MKHVRALVESLEGAADDLFRVAEAVGGGSVDPVDAELERAADRRDRVVVLLWSPAELPAAASDRPGAETDARDLEARGAELRGLELCLLHRFSFRSGSARSRRCLGNLQLLRGWSRAAQPDEGDAGGDQRQHGACEQRTAEAVDEGRERCELGRPSCDGCDRSALASDDERAQMRRFRLARRREQGELLVPLRTRKQRGHRAEDGDPERPR